MLHLFIRTSYRNSGDCQTLNLVIKPRPVAALLQAADEDARLNTTKSDAQLLALFELDVQYQ